MSKIAIGELNRLLWDPASGDFVPAFKQNTSTCIAASHAVLDIAADEADGDDELLDTVINIGINADKMATDNPELLQGCEPYFEATATLLAIEGKVGSDKNGATDVAVREKRSLASVRGLLATVATFVVGVGSRVATFGRTAAMSSYMTFSAAPRWVKVAAISMTASTFFGTGFQIAALATRQELNCDSCEGKVKPLPGATTEKTPFNPKKGECFLDEMGDYVQDGHCEPARRRKRRMTVECHDSKCLIWPKRVRRSQKEPMWITKAKAESYYPSMTMAANSTLWNMGTFAAISMEQKEEDLAAALKAQEPWDEASQAVQLAAFQACKHLLPESHPDEHFGLLSDPDLVERFAKCQEGVRDAHKDADRPVSRRQRSVMVTPRELEKLVRAAGCILVMNDDKRPGERPNMFIDCTDKEYRIRSMNFGCRLVNTMDRHLGSLLAKLGAERDYTLTKCEECKNWATCRRMKPYKEKCLGPKPAKGFYTLQAPEEMMLRLDLEVLGAGFGCTGKKRRRRSKPRPSKGFRELDFERMILTIEQSMGRGGQFEKFMRAFGNIDSACENEEAPMVALKTALFSRIVGKKEIERAEAAAEEVVLFYKNEVNDALRGELPTRNEMRAWRKQPKGMWAIRATDKFLSMTMDQADIVTEAFTRYRPGASWVKTTVPATGDMGMQEAMATAVMLKSPRAQVELKCEERQLLALLLILHAEGEVDGRADCFGPQMVKDEESGCHGRELVTDKIPFCIDLEDQGIRSGYRKRMEKRCVDHQVGEVRRFKDYLADNIRGRMMNRWKWAFEVMRPGRRGRSLIKASRGMRDFCRVTTAHIILELLGLSVPCILWDIVVTLSKGDPRLKVSEDTALNVWPEYHRTPLTPLFRLVLFAVPVEIIEPTKERLSTSLAPGDTDCTGLSEARCTRKVRARCGWLYLSQMSKYALDNFEGLSPAVCSDAVNTWMWERLAAEPELAPAWRTPCLNEAGPGWGDRIADGTAIFNGTALKAAGIPMEDIWTDLVESDRTSNAYLAFGRLSELARKVSRTCRQHITSEWRQMARRTNPRFSEFKSMTEKELRKEEMARKSGVEPYRELGHSNKTTKGNPRGLRDKTIQTGARSDGWTDTHRPMNSRVARAAPSECAVNRDVSFYGNNVNDGLANKQPDVANCRASCRAMEAEYYDFNYAGNQGCYCKFSDAGRRRQPGVMSGTTRCYDAGRPVTNPRIGEFRSGDKAVKDGGAMKPMCQDDVGINYHGNDSEAAGKKLCFAKHKVWSCHNVRKEENGLEDCRKFCRMKGESLFSYKVSERWCACKFSSSGYTSNSEWVSGETTCRPYRRNSAASILAQMKVCNDIAGVDFVGHDDGSPNRRKCFQKKSGTYCTDVRKYSDVEMCRDFCRGSNFFSYDQALGRCWCKHSDGGATKKDKFRSYISGRVDCLRPDMCIFGDEKACARTDLEKGHPQGEWADWDEWDEQKEACFVGPALDLTPMRVNASICDVSLNTMLRRWRLRMNREGVETSIRGRPLHRTRRIVVGKYQGETKSADYALRCTQIEATLPGRFVTIPGQRCWFPRTDDCTPNQVSYIPVAKIGPSTEEEEKDYIWKLNRPGKDCNLFEYTLWPSPDEVFYKAMSSLYCDEAMTGADCWAVINTREPVDKDEELAWMWAASGGLPVLPYVLQLLAYDVEEASALHGWGNQVEKYKAREEWLRRAECFPVDCQRGGRWWTTDAADDSAAPWSAPLFPGAEAAMPGEDWQWLRTTQLERIDDPEPLCADSKEGSKPKETTALPEQLHELLDAIAGPLVPQEVVDKARQRMKREATNGAPTQVSAEEQTIPSIWHVKVGKTAASEHYQTLAFELPAEPVDEGLAFLNDGVLHRIRQEFKGRTIPNPFKWKAEKDGLTRTQATLLKRRDQLIQERARWIKFGLATRGKFRDHRDKESINAMIRAEEKKWLRRRNQRSVPEPESLAFRELFCDYCTSSHESEVERFRELMRPKRQLSAAIGFMGIVTVAHYLMGVLNGDQVGAMHKRLGHLRKVAEETYGNLGTVSGTVQNLARMNARLVEGMKNEQSSWEWDLMWTAHFKEVSEMARMQMETVASAAAQTVHPALLTQVDLGRWAEKLIKIEEDTGYSPLLESPLQWLALPCTFSALSGPVVRPDGTTTTAFTGTRYMIRLPLEKASRNMVMLQQIDAPIPAGNGEHVRIAPTEARTLVVSAHGPNAQKEWTTMTAGEMARCRRMGQSYTCPSIGALRRPVKDTIETDYDDDLCAYAVWRGHAKLQRRACRMRHVLEDVIARKVDGHKFVVFTRNETEINVECENKKYTKDKATWRIKQVTILHLPPGCRAWNTQLSILSDNEPVGNPLDVLDRQEVSASTRVMLEQMTEHERGFTDWMAQAAQSAEMAEAIEGGAAKDHKAIRREFAKFKKDEEQDSRHESTWHWLISNLMLTILVAAAGLATLWAARWAANNWKTERSSMSVRMDVLEKGDPDGGDENNAKASLRGLRMRVEQLEMDVSKAFAIAEGELWYGGCEVVRKLTEDILRSVSERKDGQLPSAAVVVEEARLTNRLREALRDRHGVTKMNQVADSLEAGASRYAASAPASGLRALEDKRDTTRPYPPSYDSTNPHARRSDWTKE